jgi:hypothetical protein
MTWVVLNMHKLPTRVVPPLLVLAADADRYGEGARAWVTDRRVRGEPIPRPGIAKLSGISVRLTRERIAELERIGVIVRGDQRLVEHIQANRRPVVWDLPGVRADYIASSSGVFRD